MSQTIIGIIGGSGLYEIEGFENKEKIDIETPYGSPSASLIRGEMAGKEVVFLPRHGSGHTLLPTHINYRANIYALASLGVKNIISISAVGSMKETLHPGDIVIVDQFIDLTKHRVSTFFEPGLAGHVSLAEPTCKKLCEMIFEMSKEGVGTIHKNGTYICMEGPQFSTRAESKVYRSWGVDVIGMTNVTEAKLAREAGICFATVAMVTDYDCWHEDDNDVSVESVLETLRKNSDKAKKLIQKIIPSLNDEDCSCHHANDMAIITNPSSIHSELKERLKPVLGR